MQQSVRALSRVDEVQARRDVAQGLVQVRLCVLHELLDDVLGYPRGEQEWLKEAYELEPGVAFGMKEEGVQDEEGKEGRVYESEANLDGDH